MEQKVTLIRIRREDRNVKYVACENDGTPIKGFDKLSDICKHWKQAIKLGYVELVQELDHKPNLERTRDTLKCLKAILKAQKRYQPLLRS